MNKNGQESDSNCDNLLSNSKNGQTGMIMANVRPKQKNDNLQKNENPETIYVAVYEDDIQGFLLSKMK